MREERKAKESEYNKCNKNEIVFNQNKEKDTEKDKCFLIKKEQEEINFDSINFDINPFNNQNSEIQQNNYIWNDIINDELILKEKENLDYQYSTSSVKGKNNSSINRQQLSLISQKD